MEAYTFERTDSCSLDALCSGPASHRRGAVLHLARHAEALQHSTGTDGPGAAGVDVRGRGHPGDVRGSCHTARPLGPADRVPAVGRDGRRLLHEARAQSILPTAEWRRTRRALLLHLAFLCRGGAGCLRRALPTLTTFTAR